MKHQSKFIFLLLSLIAVSYWACTKSSPSEQNKSTVSAQVVGGQIALNLKQILYGEYGTFSIADGIDEPITMSAKQKNHLKIQSTNDGTPECGFKVDTAFSFDFDLSDTAKFNIWTKIKYEAFCKNEVFSGISVYDSLNVSATTSAYTIQLKSGETLVITKLTPGSRTSQLTMNGSLNSYSNVQPKKASEKPMIGSYNFNFTGLTIDPVKRGDIINGMATFATKGSSAEGVWDYKGTIIFLGDHKAKITINGSAYTYDLETIQGV
ncbi:hypothetical protein SNE25_06500 [Mucilaginibacter sabulilitoris]|uniref:Lipocalin-like domain-containing protein n=1 Tax=Mucilaginibacter sabulilitoris TaxID=1173583 RepID=A0ABZ0TPU5_9SPHI|nr:hypothetical protein [Mucilaginibacter sabulilitoris]WPU95174.1 hypothetical protein SNE25_06500 [Mucilaginibacter sabulilitoris]